MRARTVHGGGAATGPPGSAGARAGRGAPRPNPNANPNPDPNPDTNHSPNTNPNTNPNTKPNTKPNTNPTTNPNANPNTNPNTNPKQTLLDLAWRLLQWRPEARISAAAALRHPALSLAGGEAAGVAAGRELVMKR